MNVDHTQPVQDSVEASAEEKAEFEKMRKAILGRGDKGLWHLVPKRALFKSFWLILVLLAIVWMQRNTGTVARLFNQSLSPSSPSSAPTRTGTPPSVPRETAK